MNYVPRLYRINFILCISLLLVTGGEALSKDYQGVLRDPVNLGAWLYQSECIRCHGNYDEGQMASDYDEIEEVVESLSGDGCKINWSREQGGIYGAKELKSLATYMLKWESDGPLNLPDLPPSPIKEKRDVQKVGEKKKVTSVENEVGIDPALQKVLDTSTIAQGGWLYTNNCYRCHLAYEQARMGKGVEKETVRRFITEGKTSTQMKPFSRLLGGPLRTGEIEAVVQYIMNWEAFGERPAIAEPLMTPPTFDPGQFKPIRLTKFRVISGSPADGGRLYRMNCSGCHGSNRQGRLGPSLEQVFTLRSDLYIKSVVKLGIPGSLMKSWQQAKGGELSPKDIDDVVSFLTNNNI